MRLPPPYTYVCVCSFKFLGCRSIKLPPKAPNDMEFLGVSGAHPWPQLPEMLRITSQGMPGRFGKTLSQDKVQGDRGQWKGACPTSAKPWVQFLESCHIQTLTKVFIQSLSIERLGTSLYLNWLSLLASPLLAHNLGSCRVMESISQVGWP